MYGRCSIVLIWLISFLFPLLKCTHCVTRICYVQEAAIEEYFKPIDKEAEILMKMQLEGEEKTAREMMRTLQQQALLEKVEAEKISTLHQADAKHHKQDQTQTSFETPSQAQMR